MREQLRVSKVKGPRDVLAQDNIVLTSHCALSASKKSSELEARQRGGGEQPPRRGSGQSGREEESEQHEKGSGAARAQGGERASQRGERGSEGREAGKAKRKAGQRRPRERKGRSKEGSGAAPGGVGKEQRGERSSQREERSGAVRAPGGRQCKDTHSLTCDIIVKAYTTPGQSWCKGQCSVDGEPFLQSDNDNKVTFLGDLEKAAKATPVWTDSIQRLDYLG
ncbi:hypothetical protein LEMLEM_LOCUS20042 [Lemmus lemmus]